MNKRELAALICKTFSLYLFIHVLNALPLTFIPAFIFADPHSSLVQPPDTATRVAWFLNVVPVLLNLLAAFLLWLRADAIAGRMVRNAAPLASSGLEPELQVVAFSALGLFSLLQAIPRLSGMATTFYLMKRYDPMHYQQSPEIACSNIVAAIIQLLLGLWLLLGASGLVNLIKSFRTAGMDKAVKN